MLNSMLIIRHSALVLCLVPFLFACGEKQSETTSAPTSVITQKITIDKGSGTKPADQTKGEQPKTVGEQKADTPADDDPGGISLTRINYSQDGKLDPFAPLFREEVKTDKPKPKRDPNVKRVKSSPRRIPRTPLEKLDVSQLKLVAIIRSDKGNKALVQDASGKGYVLNKGTFIGNKAGFVTQITKNKVLIEEEEDDEAVDTDGYTTIRKRELAIQKPVGEI